jgi:hypothetical protein
MSAMRVLDRRFWEEVDPRLVGDASMRAFRVRDGVATQVLCSKTGLPLCAVQILAGKATPSNQNAVPAVMYTRSDPSPDLAQHRTHALVGADGVEFTFGLTNFSYDHQLLMPILRTQADGLKMQGAVNEINVVEPWSVVTVEADFTAGNRRLILDTIKGNDGRTPILSVRQDEADAKSQNGSKGLYFLLSARPPNGSEAAELRELFRGARWTTDLEFVVVPAAITPPNPPPFAAAAQPSQAAFNGGSLWGSRHSRPSSMESSFTFGSPPQPPAAPASRIFGPSSSGWAFEESALSNSPAPVFRSNFFEKLGAEYGRGQLSRSNGAPVMEEGFGESWACAASEEESDNEPAQAASAAAATTTRPASAQPAFAAAATPRPSTALAAATRRPATAAAAPATPVSLPEPAMAAATTSAAAAAAAARAAAVGSGGLDAERLALILDSKAATIKHGDRVLVSGRSCATVFDYDLAVPVCVLGLSVWAGLVTVPAGPVDPDQLRLCVAAAKHGFANLLESPPFVADECAICLDDRPDTVLYPCRHQCCHFRCFADLAAANPAAAAAANGNNNRNQPPGGQAAAAAEDVNAVNVLPVAGVLCPACRAAVRAYVRPLEPVQPLPHPERRARQTVPFAVLERERALWKRMLEVAKASGVTAVLAQEKELGLNAKLNAKMALEGLAATRKELDNLRDQLRHQLEALNQRESALAGFQDRLSNKAWVASSEFAFLAPSFQLADRGPTAHPFLNPNPNANPFPGRANTYPLVPSLNGGLAASGAHNQFGFGPNLALQSGPNGGLAPSFQSAGLDQPAHSAIAGAETPFRVEDLTPPKGQRLLCAKLHVMSSIQMRPFGYPTQGYNCDVCGKTEISYDRLFFHCNHCTDYDMCPDCTQRALSAINL